MIINITETAKNILINLIQFSLNKEWAERREGKLYVYVAYYWT